MLYASTVAALKLQLGSGLFAEDIFGTVPNDINAAGYRAFSLHKDSDVPLTEEEKQKAEERLDGVTTAGVGTGGAYVHGVAFPVDQDVLDCLQDFKAGNINYVQLDIDLTKERIILSDAASESIGGVGKHFPNNFPRFHYYRWDHDHEGQQISSTIFVYSCPDGSHGTQSAPVKHRMLFSSSKANAAAILEGQGITIDCKLELNAGVEFTEAEISAIVHPAKAEAKKVISKPKPQAQRKLIRGSNQ
jgi:twinfilin-like protein